MRQDRHIPIRSGDVVNLLNSGKTNYRKGVPNGENEQFVIVDPGSDQDPILVSRIETDGEDSWILRPDKTRLGPPSPFPTELYRMGTPLPGRMQPRHIEEALARDNGGEINESDAEILQRGRRRPSRALTIPWRKSSN